MWEVKLEYEDLKEIFKKEKINLESKELNSECNETIKEIEDLKKKKKEKSKEEIIIKIND